MIYRGKIYDSKNNPIAGAAVFFTLPSGEKIDYVIVTPATGEWVINADTDGGLLDTGNTVHFAAPGYYEYSISAETMPGNFNVTLTKKINPAIILGVGAGTMLLLLGSGKKKIKGLTTEGVKPYLLIGGAALGFLLLKQGLEATGIWDSADTKELDHAVTNPGSIWSPTYWRQYQNKVTISSDKAAQMVDQIQDYFGAFNDDEAGAVAFIKANIHSKADLSYFADMFYQIYGSDLLLWLRGGLWPLDNLSDADVNSINKYVLSLP